MPEVEATPTPAAEPEVRLDVVAGEVAPGAGQSTLSLSSEQKQSLCQTLLKITESYDAAMGQRRKRWREIEKAYNLVPDTLRQGQRPDASRLVSELTRSSTNLATSNLVESLIGTKDGLLMAQVTDDQDESPETAEAVEIAEGIESFLEAYTRTEMEIERKLYENIHGLAKLGNSRVRVMWEVEEEKFAYRDQDNRIVHETNERGKVAWDEIPLRLCISYPISETDLQKAMVVGHRTHMEHFEFKSLCSRLGVSDAKVREILGESDPDEVAPVDERDEELEENLKDQDINIAGDASIEGQIQVTELWCNLPLPGKRKATKFYCFLVESHRELLWCDYNPLLYQRMPYFDFPYWREKESIFGAGVGHESLFPQAADSAMWNLQIDNLKVIGNHLRIFKAGSTAEAMRDEVGPGRDLVTEDPEGDVIMHPIGGELGVIQESQDRNDFRQMRATGMPAPTQGFADPVLKSGASPGSYMQLIAQANKKFKQVDINIRQELSRAFRFVLELLQQYAPDGLYYEHVSDATARKVSRIHFEPPRGNLWKRFRVSIKPPSAASNKESLRTNLMLIYNMTMQSVPAFLQMAQATYGATDPAKLLKMQEGWLLFLQKLYTELLEVHDVPGLSAAVPKFKETPPDLIINALIQQIERMQQALLMGAQGGAGEVREPQLAGPRAEQGLSQAIPFPQGN